MPGQQKRTIIWPYREGLRMDEAMNPLTILATGLYGHEMPNQNGAPIRLVVPWKYGFKSIKSIVEIRFLDTQPETSWETKNAWCMPGGKIAFYTGILPVCKNDDGIAAVMGHEIAHAFARHTVEKLTQASMMQMATIGISRSKYAELLNKSFRVGNVGGNVYNSVVKYGIFLPFSRKMESEADYLGMGFMNLAGFNIKEPAKLWQRMMADQEGRMPEFMGSHPSPDNRSKKFLEWESEILDKFPQV